MRVQAYAASDTGLHRESNEDGYIVDDELRLYAVTDGMGGHAAGEVAAEKALSFAADYIRERRALLRNANEAPDGHFRILQMAEDALEEASLQLHALGSSDPELAGMGTTLTMLLVVGDKGIMSHVGDSRLYLLRDEKLHLLSSDHTLANEMLLVGSMTSEEANKSRYAHILTRSIGQQESVQVESLLFDLFPGDVCLLCSDGLSRYMESSDQVTRLLREKRLDSIPRKLIEFANSRGGADNITTVVLKVEAGTGEKCPDPERLQHCLQVMRSVFLFEGLSLSRLTRLINIATFDEYRQGERMIDVGQDCNGIYIILGGSFTVEDEIGFGHRLEQGEFFGETSLLFKHQSPATVIAEKPSRTIFIPSREFNKLARRLPMFGRILLGRLGQQLSKEVYRLSWEADADQSTSPWK